MSKSMSDARADRIGNIVGMAFIVALGALFAYGYVGAVLFG